MRVGMGATAIEFGVNEARPSLAPLFRAAQSPGLLARANCRRYIRQ
jgi:hypothetical protein